MSRITALVSAYYADKYLERRIDNMLACKITPEIVVVCRSGSVEHKIAQQYPVTTIATQGVPTIGRAWNIGIKLSGGKYLTTANADDLWLPGGMEHLIKVLDDNEDIDVVFLKVRRSKNGVIENWDRYKAASGMIDFPYEFLSRRFVIGPMPVWRRSIHKSVGMFDESLEVAADYDMFLRAADAAMSFYYLSDACGIYEHRDDSLEHRNKAALREENKIVRDRYARR